MTSIISSVACICFFVRSWNYSPADVDRCRIQGLQVWLSASNWKWPFWVLKTNRAAAGTNGPRYSSPLSASLLKPLLLPLKVDNTDDHPPVKIRIALLTSYSWTIRANHNKCWKFAKNFQKITTMIQSSDSGSCRPRGRRRYAQGHPRSKTIELGTLSEVDEDIYHNKEGEMLFAINAWLVGKMHSNVFSLSSSHSK